MPKIKTHKSVKKRVVRRKASGLILRKMSISHRARFKSKRAKRQASANQIIGGKVAKKLKAVI